MDKREEFISIAQQNIKREGIDALLSYLDKTDFLHGTSKY